MVIAVQPMSLSIEPGMATTFKFSPFRVLSLLKACAPRMEPSPPMTITLSIHQLFQQSVDGIISEGGTILGSARCNEFKLKFYQKMAERNLQKLGIENVIVIGGDGSIRGALALSKLK